MPVQIGFIDSAGHARLRVKIKGTNPGVVVEEDALLDTGFTGFLMLPIATALPLGVVLLGTGSYTIADGSTVTNLLAKGTVSVGPPFDLPLPPNPDLLREESIEGVFVLGGDTVLLGMEFLRGLDKLLILGKVVALVDNSLVDAALRSASAASG